MDAQLTRNWAPLTGLVAGPFKLIDLPLARAATTSRPIPARRRISSAQNPERARALRALLRDRLAQLAARGCRRRNGWRSTPTRASSSRRSAT